MKTINSLLNHAHLKDQELDMFTFFEMTPDLVCIASKEGYFKKVNPAVIDKLGYSKNELFSSPIASFIHKEDQELTSRRRAKLLQGKALMNFENRYVTKKGEIVWLAWTSIYFPDKEIVFAIAKDISERKQIERDIEEKYKKFKSLASHFKSSLEDNQKYLASELHDELAQLAVVVKMDMDWISNNEPDLEESSKNRLAHALIISDRMIHTIQKISFSISPHMLEDLGLKATLEWQCKEFSILNGIPGHFENNYNENDLTPEIQLDFFRICQECLTNIINHAQASSVNISIKEVGSNIILSVIDNGKGFNFHQKESSPGLLHMRERVSSINGQLTIKSIIGKGTSVTVVIAKP